MYAAFLLSRECDPGEAATVSLTLNLEVAGLLHQTVDLAEVVRHADLAAAHEVEDVPEHLAVAVDEVVLLQRVQHYGHLAVEQLGQPRLRKPGGRETGDDSPAVSDICVSI